MYPYRPPLAYVVPTADMCVAQGHQHVDPQGMVYLPYLSTWNPASHNLLGLAQTMCQVFGNHPPLYARGQQQQQHQQQSYQPSWMQQQQQSSIPAAYPGAPASSSSSSPYQTNSPYPGVSSSSSSQMQPSPYPGAYGQPQQQQPQHMQWESQMPPSHRPAPPPPEDPTVAARRKKREELAAKIRAKLGETLDHDRNGVAQLLREHAEKAAEAQKHAERTQRLEREAQQLDAELAAAKKRLDDAERWLAAHKRVDSEGREKPFDVDEASDPADVWRRQLVRAIALDSTLEDVIYTLNRALAAGRLPLDEFLKLCRTTCTEQFIARATVMKVREAIQQSSG